MMNAASWFEIPVADLERARTFYGLIFQAEFQVMPAGNSGRTLALFPVDFSKGVGGALVQGPGYTPPSPLEGIKLYLNGGDDLGAILGRAEAAGGKIAVPKMQISPEFGYMGAFIDSEGNWVGLHSTR